MFLPNKTFTFRKSTVILFSVTEIVQRYNDKVIMDTVKQTNTYEKRGKSFRRQALK